MIGVYELVATGRESPSLDRTLAWDVWEATTGRPLPPNLPQPTYWTFLAFHKLGVFANDGFAVVEARDGDRVLHRLSVFPRSFRFPFMGPDDLQIGDVFTATSARGRGLATAGIGFAIARLGRPGRRFWYLVEDDNEASIRAALRVGFRRTCSAVRTAPLGLRLFGHFQLTRPE